MNTEYKIYKLDELEGKDYIEIRLGKQRKKAFKKSSAYCKPVIFEMFEGAIWAKYREYSPGRPIAIQKSEWYRILDEFDDVVKTLMKSTSVDEVKEILRVSNHNSLPIHADFDTFKSDVSNMFQSLTKWLQESLKKENYISICG